VLGTVDSLQLRLHRSQPYNNIATLGQEPQTMAFANPADLDSNIISQDYRHMRSISSDRKPVCSPNEYFCLEMSRSNTVMDNHTAKTATAMNGYSEKNCTLPAPKMDSLHPHRNPADETTERNSCTSHTSRRSGIPVSSTLL